MNKSLRLLAIIPVVAFSVMSCKKDDAVASKSTSANSEAISTVEVHLTEVGTSNELVFKWKKPEGSSVKVQDIVLAKGKAYNAVIKLYDNAKRLVTNAEQHLSFESSASSSIAVVDLSTNVEGVVNGLSSRWVTEAGGTGNIRIVIGGASSETEAQFDTTVK